MKEFLQEGDIFEVREGMRISGEIPKHFAYGNCKGDFTLTKTGFVVEGELTYFAGRYVVYKTTYDGGGTGHGPGDVYPDGHHVFAERLVDKKAQPYDQDYSGTKIEFYQSGCFTNEVLPRDIEVVGHARLKYVEE